MELLVCVAIIGILASIAMPAMSRAMEQTRRAVCGNNLRQLGMCLLMYAAEADGWFPPLQQTYGPGCLNGPLPPMMFRGRIMYPEYLTDTRILVCPSDLHGRELYESGRWLATDVMDSPGTRPSIYPCLIDDLSYHYVPWVFRDEWLLDNATFDYDIDFYDGMRIAMTQAGGENPRIPKWKFRDESGRSRDVFPLQIGIERFLIPDIDAPWRAFVSDTGIPLMFDHVSTNPVHFNHLPGGTNVLFIDGHVEFVKYPQQQPYPASRAWAMLVTTLNSDNFLDGTGIP